MRFRFAAALVAGAILLVPGPPARAQLQAASPGMESMLLTERDAVLIDLPELAAQGLVTSTMWSPTGKYVLTARGKMDVASALAGHPTMESSLVVWSMATRQRRDLWKSAAMSGIESIQWLGQSDVALGIVHQPAPPAGPAPGPPGARPGDERWVLRVDAARGAVRPLLRVGQDAWVVASRSRPAAAIFSTQERSLRLVNADGSLRDFSPLVSKLLTSSYFWSDDGTRLEFLGSDLPENPQQKPRHGWYALEIATGRLTGPTAGHSPWARPIETAAPYRLKSGSLTAKEAKASQEIHPLWLESTAPSEKPLALVSAHSPSGLLSPKMDAVLYVSEGAAWVRPLVRIDRAVYQAARDAAARAQLMSNMKQVGLGVMMYAQDYDETLPAAGTDVPSVLDPYLKNRSVFEGLVYTFPGGKLSDVEEPAKTELGYVPAPGGRVLLFVDGHVQFMPEKK